MSSDHREQAARNSPQPAGQGLTPDQLKAKLSLYAGTLPSTVLEDLFQSLRSMALSESKVDEIIDGAVKSYNGQDSTARMDELVEKMNNLEDTLVRALKSMERQPAQPQAEEQVFEQPSPEPAYAPQTRRPQVPESPTEPEQDYEEEETTIRAQSRQNPLDRYQRVLLADVPDDAVSNAVLLKWVEFLLETVGHQNLPEVLDYYVDIGWISERVTMKLLAYASGMVAPRGRSKEKLSTKDHLRSLLFIEKLRGKDFDQSKLTRLEREIEYTIEKRIRHD